jgi:hypothetical protein
MSYDSHTHLLSQYYGINGNSPGKQDSPTTILSHQFDGTQSLFEVAARLVDGKDLLNDALTTITVKNATTKNDKHCYQSHHKVSAASNGNCIDNVTEVCQFGWSHCWQKLCLQERGGQQKKKIKSSKIIENTGFVTANKFVN